MQIITHLGRLQIHVLGDAKLSIILFNFNLNILLLVMLGFFPYCVAIFFFLKKKKKKGKEQIIYKLHFCFIWIF